MSLFDKLRDGFTGKQTKAKEVDLTQFKEKLKKIVYDDELVDEFAPIFAALSAHEGFDKVIELLETKESQLEHIAGGELFNSKLEDDQEFTQEDDDKNDDVAMSATDLLKQKYSEK